LRDLDLNQDSAPPTGVCCCLGNFYSENCDDGHRHDGDCFRLLRVVDRLLLRLRPALRRTVMIFDYSLAGLVTAGLLVYLIYALLKPELF
jgi:K+-transporting ATPase KdpF subunit